MADEAEDTAVQINPFKIINRGEDTLGANNEVVFADFSPRIVPADAPDEDIEVAPKGVSAPERASSQEPASTESSEPKTSGKTVQTPADEADGKPSQSENSKPASSSAKKTG